MFTRSYRPQDVREFLRLLDRELRRPVTITVIGGAAIGLTCDNRHATTDIDLTPIGDEEFWRAVERARKRMPEPVPVQSAGIYAAPYEYESRRTPLPLDGVRHLRVLVPEVHDLALMKVARGLTHDLEAVQGIHRVHPLDLETLIERYYDTLTQVMGPVENFTLSFLSLVDRLFGAAVAGEIEQRLQQGTPPPVRSV